MNGGVSIKHHSRLNAGFYLYSWCGILFWQVVQKKYNFIVIIQKIVKNVFRNEQSFVNYEF